MAIETGPLPIPSNIRSFKETHYALTESIIRGSAEIVYDHGTKKFDKFEMKFDGLKVDELPYLIHQLSKIRDEINPPKNIEQKRKTWWHYAGIIRDRKIL